MKLALIVVLSLGSFGLHAESVGGGEEAIYDYNQMGKIEAQGNLGNQHLKRITDQRELNRRDESLKLERQMTSNIQALNRLQVVAADNHQSVSSLGQTIAVAQQLLDGSRKSDPSLLEGYNERRAASAEISKLLVEAKLNGSQAISPEG